jgi:hypothetical protein
MHKLESDYTQKPSSFVAIHMQIPIGLTELDVHVLAPKTQQLQD